MTLIINFTKTVFVPFSSYKNGLPSYDILFIKYPEYRTAIKSTNAVKYLGIYTDSHLKWDIHINNTLNSDV